MAEANVQYRFLPWTRRGLSAKITDEDNGSDLRARGRISVGLTVTNITPDPSIDLSLYGPGDVLGIDPRLIVRCSPHAGITNYEPNHFVAIEFDPPDFPWMFTPAKASADRLRPWLVLIVLDRQFVGLPKVDQLRPLPTVTIPPEVSADELPNLSESWAWAHTQVVTRKDSALPMEAELQGDPNANVSRLICPRRLKPNRQYIACLVPAFDAGVARGLGDIPDPSKPLAPAWKMDNPGEVILPVYYHWEFATGPLGDFKSLAKKLNPFRAPKEMEIGFISMYIGDGGPDLPFIAADQEAANTKMDGALRKPKGDSGALEDIPQVLRDGLTSVLNAPSEQLASGPSDATPVLGPPLYGQWQARQFTITDTMPIWMHELNLDPRTRVAAGLGTEVVRKYQEEFMQKCWEQVGEILKANQRLNWGRLGMEANRRAFERHFQPLAKDRLLLLTSAVQRRTLLNDKTISMQIHLSSTPDSIVDSAMRRTISPQRPLYQKTVRRLLVENRLDATFRQTMRSSLVDTLSVGNLAVDPTRFSPDGLVGSRLLDSIQAGNLTEVAGLRVDINVINSLQTRIQQSGVADVLQNPPSIQVRPDLVTTGVITQTHIDGIRAIEQEQPDERAINTFDMLQSILEVSRQNPTAQGMLVTREADERFSMDPIFLGADAKLQIRDHGIFRDIAELELGTAASATNISQLLTDLPANTVSRAGTNPLRIGRVENGPLVINGNMLNVHDHVHALGQQIHQPVGTIHEQGTVVNHAPTGHEISKTIALPFKNTSAVQQFATKLNQTLQDHAPQLTRDQGQLVPLDLTTIASTLLVRINPVNIVPKRLQELIKVEGSSLAAIVGRESGIHVTAELDRIMAAPDLPAPAYQYLSGYDKERFCPGIGLIPPNSITLLETNPRFIEAFMVGLNYEMNREMLWREFPTDQRGTPFRYFWSWVDGNPDLTLPIHQWNPHVKVGGNIRGAGLGGQIVMLVRGELIRRYPNAVMLAWKAEMKNGKAVLKDPHADNELKTPVFQGKLDPDIIFAGFDLRDDDLKQGDGWFFLIQEQPTEPRFAFDQKQPTEPRFAESQDSAHIASITLQRPTRVAVHSKFLADLT